MPQLLTTVLNGGVNPGVSGTGARFSYAMCSYSPENSVGGFAFYDQNFAQPINWGTPTTTNNYGASSVVNMSDSTNLNYNSFFNWLASTGTQPGSNTTPNYMNATNSQGEFGNACIDVYSDGTFGRAQRSSSNNANKHYLNAYAINSDHSNKRIVYLLKSGVIDAVDRLYGTFNTSLDGTAPFTVTSLDASMQGSASYNHARRELTILSYVTSGGSFNVITFQNVDFNLYPSPAVALTQPGVVRVNSTVSMASNWGVNNSESYYNLKPIVTANGDVYVTVMFTSSSYALYRFTRSGTSAITATYLTAISLTTSYGLDQGFQYGNRQITSRDGSTVATFCPYYYYGAGVSCFMIDKTNNNYATYSNTSSSAGYAVVPFGNNGWAIGFNGNGYSSNWSGNRVQVVFTRNTTGGGFSQTGTTLYYPSFPIPNTTNYPGLAMTTDYMLLTGGSSGPKLAA